MGYSISERVAFLNRYRGTADAAVPATLYLVLYTTNPTDDTGTGGVEATTAQWTNYARLAITMNAANWSAPAGGTTSPQQSSNTAVLTVSASATIPGANPVITGAALFDAASAGNLWTWAALGSNQTISNGDPVTFPIGNMILQA